MEVETCYSRINQNGDRHTKLKGRRRWKQKLAIPELNPNGDRHTIFQGRRRCDEKLAIPEW